MVASITTTRLTHLKTDMKTTALLAAILLFLVSPAEAKEKYRTATVADPYLEMHTGPGRGYPIFHVVERDETVAVIKRRTDWFLVQTTREKKGWVHVTQMTETLQQNGEKLEIYDMNLDNFSARRWEVGTMGGIFDGSDLISLYGGRAFSKNFSLELRASQTLGNFSNGYLATVNLTHQFFPEWRVSPFFTLGAGVLHVEPKATLVQAEDRTDEIGLVGFGIRTYLSRRFVFRAEYNSYVVFTSRDENEEVDEWKAGFSFFF